MKERETIRRHQLTVLQELLKELARQKNPFYLPRLKAAGLTAGAESLEHFVAAMPFTLKAELVEDQRLHPPYGSNLTYELDRYVRIHQTSGTSGSPLRWLDTREGWAFVTGNWQRVFRAAGVESGDRVFFPFSFGPFLGFWAAFDAAAELGCLVLPGGGLTSNGRLQVLEDNRATVVCCTPTYAIRLGEIAQSAGLKVDSVHTVIVAGEPGGSIPGVRQRISDLWAGARVLDHHGMTEIGPVSYPNVAVPGLLHIIENSYLAEVLDPESLEPVPDGQPGELVLTTLGRVGSPLLRYRTGDLVCVCKRPTAELGTSDMALEGGILSRVDDMVVVRGVNLYPGAIEKVVRRFPEISEYRVELRTRRSMLEARIEIELEASCSTGSDEMCNTLADALQTAFQLRIPVGSVEPGSLPRFELKAKRWHRVEDEG